MDYIFGRKIEAGRDHGRTRVAMTDLHACGSHFRDTCAAKDITADSAAHHESRIRSINDCVSRKVGNAYLLNSDAAHRDYLDLRFLLLFEELDLLLLEELDLLLLFFFGEVELLLF